MAEYGQTVTANEAEKNRRLKCRDGERRGGKKEWTLYISHIHTHAGVKNA